MTTGKEALMSALDFMARPVRSPAWFPTERLRLKQPAQTRRHLGSPSAAALSGDRVKERGGRELGGV